MGLGPVTVFDLSDPESAVGLRSLRRVRWVFLGLLVVSVVSTILIGLSLLQPANRTSARILFLALALVITVVFATIARGFAPGPDAIQIDGAGVHLLSSRRTVQAVNWSDPSFALTIDRTDGSPDLISQGRPAFVLRGLRPSRILLSREAFETLVREAKTRGFAVQESVPQRAWTTVTIDAPFVRPS
jgi:hypothetical protein